MRIIGITRYGGGDNYLVQTNSREMPTFQVSENILLNWQQMMMRSNQTLEGPQDREGWERYVKNIFVNGMAPIAPPDAAERLKNYTEPVRRAFLKLVGA